jgi:hypothetical protein
MFGLHPLKMKSSRRENKTFRNTKQLSETRFLRNMSVSIEVRMPSLFEFRWSVDQDGYEIKKSALTSTGPASADAVFEESRIFPLGGPHREYRPIEGLWRRFAECTDESSALAFVREFGLLFAMMRPQNSYILDEEDQLPSDSVKAILATSAIIRRIIVLTDSDRHVEAAKHWRWARPRLTAGLVPTARPGRYEFQLIPVTLSAALLLQAGDAIASNQEWRRCRNDTCSSWFRIGVGAKTKRCEFCSDRCRVADDRRHKAARAINA